MKNIIIKLFFNQGFIKEKERVLKDVLKYFLFNKSRKYKFKENQNHLQNHLKKV